MITLIIMALCALLATVLACAWLSGRKRIEQCPMFANIAEGTHEGAITKKTEAAIATRFLLGTFGADVDHIAVAGAADIPIGVITDESAAAEDLVNVNLFGSSYCTQKGVASAAIAIGEFIVPDDGGKVQTLTGLGAGTYYIVGRALTAAGADGDVIEFDPIPAVQRVVAA